jgi:tetratricopeptide (TPR) repeat protein
LKECRGASQLKNAIPVLVLLLFAWASPALCMIHLEPLPEFVSYLREAGLPALYRTELRTLCVEEGLEQACLEYGALYEEEAVRGHLPTLADSIAWQDDRRRQSGELVKAGLYCRFGEYEEALDRLGAVIDELPDKDLLVEAVLLRAQCNYHLGRVADALAELRSIRPYLPEGRAPDLALYLGLCEEAEGNLAEAEKYVREAETGGVPEASEYLLRIKLKQGDYDSFNVVAREVAGSGATRPCTIICDLARDMDTVFPEAWYALVGPLTADSGFVAAGHPGVIGSIVRLAEDGKDMTLYCNRLLSRPVDAGAAGRLRYARGLSAPESVMCDTLGALFRAGSDLALAVRSLAACLSQGDPDRGALLLNGIGPRLGEIWKSLTAEERLELSDMLAQCGRGEIVGDRIAALRQGLKVGRDDGALVRIAGVLERIGDTAGALSLYREISGSPFPSEFCLDADRAAYLLAAKVASEGDVAGVIERVAREDVSPVEIGDLFLHRLHDYPRAAVFYRRALDHPPEDVSPERIKIGLAEALAGQALETGDRRARDEALGLVAAVADTSTVGAGQILRVLAVSTAWFEGERERAFDILVSIGRRQDLSSSDLYGTARALFHLFSRRDGNVYAQCALMLRRLAKEYPVSDEAPLGAFLSARIKFLAGDYVGALEAYQACAQVWRKHEVASLCEEGIGDCYLYSGGIEEALEHYGNLKSSARSAFKTAQCYEIIDRPDSALRYYEIASAGVYWPTISEVVSLRRGLLVYERSGLDASLAALDSAFPDLRKRRGACVQAIAAYAFGKDGYLALGKERLAVLAKGGGDVGCDATLLLSMLEPGDGAARRLKDLDPGESQCQSVYGALRLLYERAYLACSSGPVETCRDERGRYLKRFPLDRRSRLRFDVHEALLLYQDGRDEAATSMIDSLAASGRRDESLAYGLYREGIRFMVAGDHARAAAIFRKVEAEYPGSDLYYDTVFKLGTAYYLLGDYDSSAVYFGTATGAAEVSLVEDAYFNLGLALEEGARFDEASAAFRNLAVRFPFSERFERGLMRAAYTLEQAGKPDEAIPLYKGVLLYAEEPETAAEALYWIGESYSEMGDPLRAACEFMRVVYLFPGGGPWSGTAAFRAGMECEKAGLPREAAVIYRDNVARFGTGSDWGKASRERLDELEASVRKHTGAGRPEPDDVGAPSDSDQAPGQRR